MTSKRAPADIGSGDLLKGYLAQEQAVVELAAIKCLEVPAGPESGGSAPDLAALKEHLGHECYGEGTGGVLELLQNPRNPQEFVETVQQSTEALDLGQDENGGALRGWRITITTAEGGRGHDYRVVDPMIDDNGGLLVILTWMPWSEREWIQFLGRTSRQDHAGQYAVLLDAEDEKVLVALPNKLHGESLPRTILKEGDKATAKQLESVGDEIFKAKLMHQLTSHYWTAFKAEETDKNQDWSWKRLCEEYTKLEGDVIKAKFKEILPDVVIKDEAMKVTREERPPTKHTSTGAPLKSMAELTCAKCGHIAFTHWRPDRPAPKVNCEKCGARTLVS
eukprot:CAMPEP_0177152100 /NCGR_PEP_ID=MMETSP0367-20130122/333_1 /TAXON_ID=447022 ORGANISM="Scrippsiella hangoei-like, Strain SHHI-4" /NCGR_SAMPLE_ID=MMETSP0367 /ASSEMBLY_ACC=CAM_ASM_000362 /LENGTH=334 /DNA_ID=CAMNT_0018597105 /DNA_START=39 /DNA_END=1041 /DNA_ORIENTATION=+